MNKKNHSIRIRCIALHTAFPFRDDICYKIRFPESSHLHDNVMSSQAYRKLISD